MHEGGSLSSIRYFWKTPDLFKGFSHAVSLHGHTLYSHEGLDFIVEQAEKRALLRWILHMQSKRCRNPKTDFSNAYWTPPLTPRGAYEVECRQIENLLGLDSMVSITDHEDIEAPLRLRLLPQTRHIPISLEWTVPFEGAQVHLGIHNLPSSSARRWLSEMRAYTREGKSEKLACLLEELNEIRDLLIVFNHPLWDLYSLGREAHSSMLRRFLGRFNHLLHAFELGGLRSWAENQRVVDLANACNQRIISGGDRHGCEPSALLNLTNANSFDEFVNEVRRERKSDLVFMPQYRQSLKLRMLRTANDATRYIAGHPMGPRWEDRTFHPDAAGEMRPLSRLWQKTPSFIRAAVAMLQMLESEPIRAWIHYVGFGSKNEFRLHPLSEDGDAA
jgi:hypothetical protein